MINRFRFIGSIHWSTRLGAEPPDTLTNKQTWFFNSINLSDRQFGKSEPSDYFTPGDHY